MGTASITSQFAHMHTDGAVAQGLLDSLADDVLAHIVEQLFDLFHAGTGGTLCCSCHRLHALLKPRLDGIRQLRDNGLLFALKFDSFQPDGLADVLALRSANKVCGSGAVDSDLKMLAQLVRAGAYLASSTGVSVSVTEGTISDPGAAALADSIRCGMPLACLLLSGNQIRDLGCIALVDALRQSGAMWRLTSINLAANAIGDAGCEALASALVECRAPYLLAISVEDNAYSLGGYMALALALDSTCAATPVGPRLRDVSIGVDQFASVQAATDAYKAVMWTRPWYVDDSEWHTSTG